MRWSRSKLVHGSSPRRTRSMEGMYSARHPSASCSQSACTPLSAPRRPALAATPMRQSTVVPKMSKVRARTSLNRSSPPEHAVVVREVALDHRELEGGEDRARRLSFEKEVEAPLDQVFHIAALDAAGPALEVGSPDRDGVLGVLARVVDGGLGQPVIGFG